MEKSRIKYIVLGFVFLGIGIVLANFFTSYRRFSIIEYIFSCMGLILLMIAPVFIFGSKRSSYFRLSVLFSAAAYIAIIILVVFHSSLPNHFEEIIIGVFMILIFLSAIFSLRSAASGLKDFIRLFKIFKRRD